MYESCFSKDTEQLKKELSLQRMKSLSESQRVLEMERKLFAAQQALKQSQGDNIKLQVKVEELRLKYEPSGNLLFETDSDCFHLYMI